MSAPRVLVTGGSKGIGRAIALRFAREGSRVVVASRNSELLDAVVAEIEEAGGQGLAAQMNVRDHGSVEAAVYRAIEFTGGAVDVLVNNAGVFDLKPIEDTSVDLFQRMLEVNLLGAFYVTTEALDALEESERAHVFNIASVAAKRGFPGCTAYGASKYGLRGFGDSLREDVRDKGIRVTTVYPGQTDTDAWNGVEGDWDRSTMDPPEAVADVIWDTWNAPADANIDDVDVPDRSTRDAPA
jgi:NAD(P)-dependent dehydrogenase (short-subunit alcohol dehydrogenase family)